MHEVLSSVRVLEYSQSVAGSFCARLLADLGAEVIKIEPPGGGDPARARGPFPGDVPHPERSGLFLHLNTNKLGITLSLASVAGRDMFLELVKGIDVLIEDTTPGTMEGMGLGWETLSGLNPGLIMTSITPYGQTGPYGNYRAYHLNFFQASGQAYHLLAEDQPPGREPLVVGGNTAHCDAGLSAALATLGALYDKGITGQGQHIDVSEQESSLALLRVEAGMHANLDVGDGSGKRGGPKKMAGGMIECQDGYVMTCTPQDHQWWALHRLVGSPELDPEWAKDRDSRIAHVKDLDGLIAPWMAEHSKEEIYHQGQALSCPVAPVESPEDLMKSVHLQARGFFREVEHPVAGRFKYATVPYGFSETPCRIARAAPLLGEHNEEVYCGRLGCTKDDLVKLRQAGII